MICKLATSEISIFYLVSVAEETGLKLALSETPKTGFLATRPIYSLIIKPHPDPHNFIGILILMYKIWESVNQVFIMFKALSKICNSRFFSLQILIQPKTGMILHVKLSANKCLSWYIQTYFPHKFTHIPPLLLSWKCFLLSTSVGDIQVHFRLQFFIQTNIMNPHRTTPFIWVYNCLQCRLHKNISRQESWRRKQWLVGKGLRHIWAATCLFGA